MIVPRPDVPSDARTCAEDPIEGFVEGGGERKFVTVLFVDLAHSSDVVAGMDPEDADDILLPIVEHLAAGVRGMGGTVTQLLGDGIMAVFGAPSAIEDHALRACEAAERIRSAARLGDVVGKRFGQILFEVRIGISSGEVVARAVMPDRWIEYRTAGEAVYLASRMESFAPPNGICITEDTLKLIGGKADVRRLGSYALAAGSEDKEIFELVSLTGNRTAPISRAHRHLTGMVGRDGVLCDLATRIPVSRDDAPGTVVIAGDAGIGKTRLVEELIALTDPRACHVVALASAPSGFSSPCQDLAALARELIGLQEAARRADGRPNTTEGLERYGLGDDERLVDLWQALGVGGHGEAHTLLDEQFDRSVALLSDVVCAMSRECPTVVVVEDIHWASSVLRRFVIDISERNRDRPILLVVTARTPAVPIVDELRAPLLVELQALPEESSCALLQELFGGAQELTAVREQIAHRTQGNPLFLVEYALALLQARALGGERGRFHHGASGMEFALPANVHGVLAARIDSLAPRERSTILAASVIGRCFDIGLLKQLTGFSDTETSRVISELERKGLVEHTRSLPSTEYSFRHALIHEVAYGTMLKRNRRHSHRRLVGEIRRRPSSLIFGKSELLADHAYRAEMWDLAYVFNRRAGENAQRLSWNAEADRYLRHARASLNRLPKGPKHQWRDLQLLAGRVRSLFALGQYEDAKELLDSVGTLPDSREIKKLACEIASLSALYHWTRSTLTEAEAAARTARELAHRQHDVGLRISCTGRLGMVLSDKGDFGRGQELLTLAEGMIPKGSDHETYGLMAVASVAFKGALARCLAERGFLGSARDVSIQGVEIAEDAKHVFSQIYANISAAMVLVGARYPEASFPLLDRAHALSLTSRFSLVRPLIASLMGTARILCGSTAEGLSLLDEAFGAPEVPSLMVRHPTQQVWLAEGYLAAGRREQAFEIASQTLVEAQRTGERPAKARCLAIMGESLIGREGGSVSGVSELIGRAGVLAETLAMRPLSARCEIALASLDFAEHRQSSASSRIAQASKMFKKCGIKPLAGAEIERLREAATI